MQMRMLVRCLPTSYAKAFVDEHDGAVAAEALAGVAAALASVPREAVELLKRHRLAKAVFSAAVQFACADPSRPSLEHAAQVLCALAPDLDDMALIESSCVALCTLVDGASAALVAIARAPPPHSTDDMLSHARVRLHVLRTLFASARNASGCAALAGLCDGAVPQLCARVLRCPSTRFDVEATRTCATLLRNLALPAESVASVSPREVMEGMAFCAATSPDPSAAGAAAAALRHVIAHEHAAARRLLGAPDAVPRFIEGAKGNGERRMHPVVRVEVARVLALALSLAGPECRAFAGAADDAAAGDAAPDSPAFRDAAEAAAIDALTSVDGVNVS